MKKPISIVAVCLVVSLLPISVNSQISDARMTLASSRIIIEGESSGGILTLMKVPAWNYPFVVVTNYTGESASSVINRLARELSESRVCARYFGGNPVAEKKENSMRLFGGGGDWIFGGTEMGFNIPPAPRDLSATYGSNKVILRWANQIPGYDSLAVFFDAVLVGSLSGNATEYVYEGQYGTRSLFNSRSNDATFTVVASKGGTPSNGAGVRLKKRVSQESLMNIPFTQGVAPSFQNWNYQTKTDDIQSKQGNLSGMGAGVDTGRFNGHGFYQIIRGQRDFTGGVSRRFLGLNPGHTYRVSARLNTFDLELGNWNFSFHAAHNAVTGESLTPAQMAGVVALPNGKVGPTAGQVASYDAKATTGGKWIVRSSEKADPENTSADITLPTNVNSITLWFRLQGTNITECSVGLDSVTIEDLGKP